MLSITQLDENIWSRVAAGEVVERPASAVKELVENSIDANAKRIRVKLSDGGRLRIIVEDDGSGIAFDELPLAIAYHATSKISSLEDLEHIMTLGYRGEALASLVAVSDVEIRSRQQDSQIGGIIRTHDGKIIEHSQINCSVGTRVQVENLFSGLPARRKFLKSAAGELRRCAVFIREYAVCNTDKSFSLEHDNKLIFSTDGSNDKSKVLAKLWESGAKIQNINVKSGHTELECWFQSRAGISKRGDIMSFVNGRAIEDLVIKSAVNNAARDLTGNWALFFTLDPTLVDVNIHPAKSEVRFRFNNEIYETISKAAKNLGTPMPLPEIISIPQISPQNPPQISSSPTITNAPQKNSSGWNFRDSPSKILNTQQNKQSEQNFHEIFTPQIIPEIIYLGQTSGGYLIYDNHESVILMDPHAAHERVNYERIKKLAARSQNTQKLLMPVMLHPTLAIETHEFEKELIDAGFMFNNTINGVELSAVPVIGNVEFEAEYLLRASIEALRKYHNGDTRDILWRIYATMACKASVKLTSDITREEAVKLWEDLQECEQPNVCPHGRPTMIEIKNSDLLKRFGRE